MYQVEEEQGNKYKVLYNGPQGKREVYVYAPNSHTALMRAKAIINNRSKRYV